MRAVLHRSVVCERDGVFSLSPPPAQIALKHRKNKHGGQRIITFVGSPVDGPRDEDLRKLGAVLKKNNIAIDIVSLGEPEQNTAKLQVRRERSS